MDRFQRMQGTKDTNNTAFSKSTDTLSSQESSQGARQDSSFTTIFVVFFVFLSLVLIIHSVNQWNDVEKNYQINMVRSVDSFVVQASLTSKASIHVNQLFAHTYQDELIKLISHNDPENQLQIQQKMNKTFFKVNF